MNNNEIEKKEIDYESLGKWLKRVRERHNLSQDEVASKFFQVSRTVLSKYESGKVKPKWEDVEAFAKTYGENVDEIRKKVSIAIPDTCALLKNKRLLQMLLEDYDLVIVPDTVADELSFRKNHGESEREKREAWQIMATIDYYVTEYGPATVNDEEDKKKRPIRIKFENNRGYKIPVETTDKRIKNDWLVIMLADAVAKKTIGDVVIITDDIDLPLFCRNRNVKVKPVKIDDYVAKRTKLIDYDVICNLDQEYDYLENYKVYIDKMPEGALDTYLPDGSTLLISCIKYNDKHKLSSENRLPMPKVKIYKKIQFLLDNGANPNRNDNGKQCLPPLAHCIQMGKEYYRAFEILLENGCDYNKASRDERTASYLKVGRLNEGNTPLMIACWEGKKIFVEKLCSYEDISLNQQDSNGYTALMKCAVRRCKFKEKGQRVNHYEELYKYLLERGADPLIRDRNNHTAQDWWNRGDDREYKADEQW